MTSVQDIGVVFNSDFSLPIIYVLCVCVQVNEN